MPISLIILKAQAVKPIYNIHPELIYFSSPIPVIEMHVSASKKFLFNVTQKKKKKAAAAFFE